MKPATSVALVLPAALAAVKSCVTSFSDGPVVPLDFAGVNVWQPPHPALLKTAKPGFAAACCFALVASALAVASHFAKSAFERTWMFLKCIDPWPEPHSSVHW